MLTSGNLVHAIGTLLEKDVLTDARELMGKSPSIAEADALRVVSEWRKELAPSRIPAFTAQKC